MAEGKKSRKFGRNKVYCKNYEMQCKEERNRKRKMRRHEREMQRKADKIAERIKVGKPVHLRHIIAALKRPNPLICRKTMDRYYAHYEEVNGATS